MILKNYEASKAVFESVEDEDVKRLMGALLSMMLSNQTLDIAEDEEVDVLVIMKLAKAFFEKKHILEAGVTGEWSDILWPLDEDIAPS